MNLQVIKLRSYNMEHGLFNVELELQDADGFGTLYLSTFGIDTAYYDMDKPSKKKFFEDEGFILQAVQSEIDDCDDIMVYLSKDYDAKLIYTPKHETKQTENGFLYRGHEVVCDNELYYISIETRKTKVFNTALQAQRAINAFIQQQK